MEMTVINECILLTVSYTQEAWHAMQTAWGSTGRMSHDVGENMVVSVGKAKPHGVTRLRSD